MNRSLGLRLAAGGITLTVIGVMAASAGADTGNAPIAQPVTVQALTGTRTLNLENLSGNTLTGLTLGLGHAGAFLANVTDVAYQNSGYNVSATMSNLYPYDAATGKYDFSGSSIPSSDVSVSYPAKNPIDLTNVSTVVQPVISLVGNLTQALQTQLLGKLGLTSLSQLTNGITTSIDTTVNGVQQSVTNLASEILDGAESDLPVKLLAGTPGAFTSAGPLTGVDDPNAPSGSSSPTQLTLLSGTANGGVAGTVNQLLTELNNQLGNLTVSKLISDGVLSQDDLLSAIADQTGLPLSFLTSNATAILNVLTPTITNLAGILGQTGSYNSLPVMSVKVPQDTASGTYQGILTVTLADTPDNS